MSKVLVFNPNTHVVAVSSDGRMLGGLKQTTIDMADPIAALAIQQKFVVIVSKEQTAPTPPAPVEPEVVAEEPVAEEAPVEETPADAEPAPTTTTRKKSSTTTTSTESKEI